MHMAIKDIPNPITIEELDKLIKLCLVNPTSRFDSIVAGLRLGAAVGFIIARKSLIDEEIQRAIVELKTKKRKVNRDDALREITSLLKVF